MVVRWLLGLIVLTVLAHITYTNRSEFLNKDVARRSQQLANEAGANWAKVSVVGRDVSVQGRAPSEADRTRLIQSIDLLRGVRLVDNAIDLLPRNTPYDWRIGRNGTTVDLSGAVPSEANRQSLTSLFKTIFPAAKFTDSAVLAVGAPTELPSMQKFALDVLARLSSGSASASDSTLRLEGIAASPEDYAALQGLINALPNGIALSGNTIVPPTITPYVFSARKAGDALTLGGFVPSIAARTALLDETRAKFPKWAIADGLRFGLAAQTPSNWAAAHASAVGFLNRLREGTLNIEDGKLTISGVAAGAFEREQILADLAKLPGGLSLARASITLAEPSPIDNLLPPVPPAASPLFADVKITPPAPPPAPPIEQLFPPLPPPAEPLFSDIQLTPATPPVVVTPAPAPSVWLAERGSRKLTISGVSLPVLRQAAARLFVADEILDGTGAGPALADPITNAALLGLDYLARLEEGTLKADASGVSLNGRAPSLTVRSEILAAIANLPAPQIVATITGPAVTASAPVHPCQSDIDRTSQVGLVTFTVGKAILSSSSVGRLQAILEVLNHCPQAQAEISGHTDDQGDPDENLELSMERAQAVADWLIKSGVSANRLKAVGFGQTKPVASNETREGRAQNRRIDFKLQ